jgi:hypothetical protein
MKSMSIASCKSSHDINDVREQDLQLHLHKPALRVSVSDLEPDRHEGLQIIGPAWFLDVSVSLLHPQHVTN